MAVPALELSCCTAHLAPLVAVWFIVRCGRHEVLQTAMMDEWNSFKIEHDPYVVTMSTIRPLYVLYPHLDRHVSPQFILLKNMCYLCI